LSIERRIEQLKARLKEHTGHAESDIQLVYSPLRISPLGAHVDHQDGLVTGMAIDRAIFLAFAPRSDKNICVQSLNFPGRVEFALDDIPPKAVGDWGNYIRGAALALQQEYDLQVGIDAIVGVAYLLALEAANELTSAPEENIQLDRYIENVYLGLQNGILDQSVILMSDRDHLTYLDCQTVQFRKFPMPDKNRAFDILVVYSGLARPLVGTDYNKRVSECQQAAQAMLEWAGQPIPETPRLRMVSEGLYAEFGDRLPEPLDRRARHFFTEVGRVREGVIAWQKGDLEMVGRLINESGASSIQNYECGCPHLITLYNILRECPGVYGARFSGGGFRGSCIALTDSAYREEIKATIDAQYPLVHPDVADQYSVHFCKPDDSARLWKG
jgi:galactokinase